jgi:ABC-type multidrug transport system fused ATPase/permease subunit
LVFLTIFLASSISVLAYTALGYYASLQASRSLFRGMLRQLVRAPARFFDKVCQSCLHQPDMRSFAATQTPIGRILNRFTSDIGTVDGALQYSARNALQGTLNFISTILVICWVVPSFLPFAFAISWLYIRLAPRYINASRDLRRLESISLSPAFAGFDELLRGIVHVRAFAMEGRFHDTFYAKVDSFQVSQL